MSNKQQQSVLVEQKDALNVYFEALLREAPELEVVTPAPVAVPVVVPVAAPVAVTPMPQVSTATESVVETVDDTPAWGKEPFQALLFRVAGLTLAVPLVELNGIQEWDGEKVTPMPGHVNWYLGLMTYRERSVPVVDTAWLVLPEERLARLEGSANERLTRIVFIGEGRWGLGCDEVAEVVTLTPEQVRWRSSRTKRRWLAGTVIEQMCALIDPSAFAVMLATGDEDAQAVS